MRELLPEFISEMYRQLTADESRGT